MFKGIQFGLFEIFTFPALTTYPLKKNYLYKISDAIFNIGYFVRQGARAPYTSTISLIKCFNIFVKSLDTKEIGSS